MPQAIERLDPINYLASLIPLIRHNGPTPYALYLSRLSVGSRRAMIESLELISEIICFGHRGNADDRAQRKRDDQQLGPRTPWHLFRYEHSVVIRSYMVENYAPAAANRHLCALRGVIREAWRMGIMSGDDMIRAIDIDHVKGDPVPAGRYVEPGELKRIVDVCLSEPGPIPIRNAACLALMFVAGLRRSEVVNLELKDYDQDTGVLSIHQSKGGRGRRTTLPAGGKRAVDNWISIRGQEDGPLITPFRHRGGEIEIRKLHGQSLYAGINRLARLAGVAKFSPHDGRRTFASDLYDSGADIILVQKLMGHSTINTTARYDRRPEVARHAAVQKLHFPYPDQGQAIGSPESGS